MRKEQSGRVIIPRKTIKNLFFNYSEERLLEEGFFIPKRVYVINVFPSMSYIPRDLDISIKKRNWEIREEISGVLIYEFLFNPFRDRKEHRIEGEMDIDINSGRYFVVPLIRDDLFNISAPRRE